MKKVVFTLLVLSIFTGNLFAQTLSASTETDAEAVEKTETPSEFESGSEEKASETSAETEIQEKEGEAAEEEAAVQTGENLLENTNVVENNSESLTETVTPTFEEKVAEKVSEYRGYVEANKLSLTRTNDAEDLIEKIEAKKAEIIEIRKKIAEVAEVYYREIDAETEEKTQEILDAPVDIVESDGNGNLSDAAMQRRKNKCAEIEAEADEQKQAFLNELNNTMGSDEKEAVQTLCSYYRALEMNKFLDSSYSENTEVAIGEFNTNEGCWPVTYSIPMFGLDKIFRTTVKISYTDVTGEKFIPLSKMTDEEFMAFHDSLEFYTAVLKEIPEVLYGKLTFQIYRWKQASEYRLMPEKFEVSLLGAKRNKIVAKVNANLTPRVFVMAPAKEIRTESEIAADIVKANKIIAQEAKAKESEADKLYKEYTDSYESSKKNSSKNPLIQKGRGAFVISASKHFTAGEVNSLSSDFDSKSLIPDLVSIDLDFPVGKFAFLGLNGGLFVPFNNGNFKFEAGLNAGFNFHVTNFLDPYLQASMVADSEYNGILKVGAGIDFIIGKMFLINLNYNFRWAYDFNNQLNPAVDKASLSASERNSIPCTSAHKISVGLGITW